MTRGQDIQTERSGVCASRLGAKYFPVRPDLTQSLVIAQLFRALLTPSRTALTRGFLSKVVSKAQFKRIFARTYLLFRFEYAQIYIYIYIYIYIFFFFLIESEISEQASRQITTEEPKKGL